MYCLLYPICESKIDSPDNGLKALRRRCHKTLDRWWLMGKMTRTEAYELLQEMMGMSEEDAHFGKFTKEQCEEFLEKTGEFV